LEAQQYQEPADEAPPSLWGRLAEMLFSRKDLGIRAHAQEAGSGMIVTDHEPC
jgi:hypothetical protein